MGDAPTVVNARYMAGNRPRPALSQIAPADAHHAAIHGETVYQPKRTFMGVNRDGCAPYRMSLGVKERVLRVDTGSVRCAA
jgi:hypothetical protein